MPKKTKPLGQDPAERADAIGRLRERTRQQKNMIDKLDDDMRKKQDGLSPRNRAIFGD